MCAPSFSCVLLFVTSWTVACHAPLPMEFSRQEYWNRVPFPPPGDLLDLGIYSENLHLLEILHGLAYSLPLALPGKPQGTAYNTDLMM